MYSQTPNNAAVTAPTCADTPKPHQPRSTAAVLANGFDPSGIEQDTDFRVNPNLPNLITPTPPAGRQLVYASALQQSEFLLAGETDTYQRDVDIDSQEIQLARLSVYAEALTERRIQDIRSCVSKNKNTSQYGDLWQFASEVRQVQQIAQAHYFCREYDIAPGNVVEELIANRPAMRVYTYLDNPNRPGTEFPAIGRDFSVAGRFDQWEAKLERKLEEVYPAGEFTSESEYAPTEKPAPSSAPAPPSGKS